MKIMFHTKSGLSSIILIGILSLSTIVIVIGLGLDSKLRRLAPIGSISAMPSIDVLNLTGYGSSKSESSISNCLIGGLSESSTI